MGEIDCDVVFANDEGKGARFRYLDQFGGEERLPQTSWTRFQEAVANAHSIESLFFMELYGDGNGRKR